MLITGILGHDCLNKTARLIEDMLFRNNKKAVIFDDDSSKHKFSDELNNYISCAETEDADVILVPLRTENTRFMSFTKDLFDSAILTDKFNDISGIYTSKFLEASDILIRHIKDDGVVIFNSDDNDIKRLSVNSDKRQLPFGFNKESYVSTSSIGELITENEFITCVSRPFQDAEGNIVHPAEYKITVRDSDAEAYSVLAACSFAIYHGYFN